MFCLNGDLNDVKQRSYFTCCSSWFSPADGTLIKKLLFAHETTIKRNQGTVDKVQCLAYVLAMSPCADSARSHVHASICKTRISSTCRIVKLDLGQVETDGWSCTTGVTVGPLQHPPQACPPTLLRDCCSR